MRNAVATRRAFLTAQARKDDPGVWPPGVTESSIRNCSGCGGCAEVCPGEIIVIRAGVPVIDFDRGECTFCGKCAERCPEPVFTPGPVSRFGHHAVIGDGCLAINYVDCQACRDACPTSAIRFAPRIGGPFTPSVNADLCSGCGGCVSVCPTRSIWLSFHAGEVADA